MRIQFLGAVETVTGSKYLIQTNQMNILVDCGLFQGYKELRLRNWSHLPIKSNARTTYELFQPLLKLRAKKRDFLCTFDSNRAD